MTDRQDPTAGLPPLARTPDMDRVGFLRVVAQHYRAWDQAVGHHIEGRMAQRSGVPVKTVSVWVWKARQCGLLPPAQGNAAMKTTAPRPFDPRLI